MSKGGVHMVLIIHFIGTTLGAACVFFMKKELSLNIQKALTGFAAGVMVAASIWSLIIPSLDQSSTFIPALIGFWLGILFLLLLDHLIPHMHLDHSQEGPRSHLSQTIKLVLAVTIHNIPEGMAVGVVYASYLSGNKGMTAMAALALSIGIAIQNFPEGAIVSMPLRSTGASRLKSFMYGTLSGIVEPIGGFITVLLSSYIISVMPYLLSFAAGAMMYVVVEELIPEMSQGEHSHLGVLLFSVGFTLMMVLDVALG